MEGKPVGYNPVLGQVGTEISSSSSRTAQPTATCDSEIDNVIFDGMNNEVEDAMNKWEQLAKQDYMGVGFDDDVDCPHSDRYQPGSKSGIYNMFAGDRSDESMTPPPPPPPKLNLPDKTAPSTGGIITDADYIKWKQNASSDYQHIDTIVENDEIPLQQPTRLPTKM